MSTLIVISSLLMAICTIGLGYWIVVACRVHRTMRRRPTIRAGLEAAEAGGPRPKVSVIVPTHNEERVIDSCARSLRGQRYEPLELIFVLDRCTDDTARILRGHADEDDRVRLVENDACPEDWAGKCHAAQLGADRADGECLLFTDADTVFEPDLVAAAVTLARQRSIHLLSLLSTLTSRRLYERIAQPAATLRLIQLYPIDRVNDPQPGRARPFANGQFMLFERDMYERLGGHAAVKDALLEDIAFARQLVHQHHGRCGVFLADGMLTCSMYDSLAQFKVGWKRIFIEACQRKARRLRKNAVRVLLGGVGLPLAQAAGVVWGITLLLGGLPLLGAAMLLPAAGSALMQFMTLMRIYALGGAPRGAALLFPIGSWIVAGIMLGGADDLVRRRPIPWGGRQYILQPRD